jgi:hypothetical protein
MPCEACMKSQPTSFTWHAEVYRNCTANPHTQQQLDIVVVFSYFLVDRNRWNKHTYLHRTGVDPVTRQGFIYCWTTKFSTCRSLQEFVQNKRSHSSSSCCCFISGQPLHAEVYKKCGTHHSHIVSSKSCCCCCCCSYNSLVESNRKNKHVCISA